MSQKTQKLIQEILEVKKQMNNLITKSGLNNKNWNNLVKKENSLQKKAREIIPVTKYRELFRF
jgi:hypothetical protein